MRIAINGFGRIGKTFLRSIALDKRAAQHIEIVAINTGKPASQYLAHLFKHDSVMGTFPLNVEQTSDTLIVGNLRIPLLACPEPQDLPWQQLGIDWVIECSGKFASKEGAQLHLQAGAKKVLISAPADDADITIIPGINHDQFNRQTHNIVSLGSCTTNCFAPLVKVLQDNFEIIGGMMTTVHAYTNDQLIVDGDHKDPRRARAAAHNMIPTKTGAEKAIIKIYPKLAGKLKAHAVRVPVIDASLIDFTVITRQETSADELNTLYKKAAASLSPGTLEYSEAPLVSGDIIGNAHGAVFDSLLTQSQGTVSRICAWYDNEFGYASRMKEFLLLNS